MKTRRISYEVNDRGCWICTSHSGANGYPEVSIEGKTDKVSRVVLEKKLGRKLMNGEEALHTCDTPACIRPDHLYCGTQKNNMIDRELRKRVEHPRGEDNGRAKLTAEQVAEIRRMWREISPKGGLQAFLGRKFGVHRSCIQRVVNNKTWEEGER